ELICAELTCRVGNKESSSRRLPPPSHSSTLQPTPVIVVAAGASSTEAQGSIDEIKNLLKGLSFPVVRTVVQRHAPKGAATILGGGKLQELKELCEEIRDTWDVMPFLAFVSEISPSQQRILERDFETVVLD